MNLPPAVQAVLEVFQGALAEVRFADIDAGALARLAADVEATAAELEEQELKVGALRQALVQHHEALLMHAQRALAYARVYAECDTELSERLNAIALPRPLKRGKGLASGTSRDSERAEGAPSEMAVGELDEPRPEPQRELFQRKGRRREVTSPSVDQRPSEAPLNT